MGDNPALLDHFFFRSALICVICGSSYAFQTASQEEAQAAGYCVRTLERAKRRLGVVARRVRKDGRALWQWSDPALPHGAGRRR